MSNPITVTPTTDLDPLVGVRVRVERTVHGHRYAYVGVFESLFRETRPERCGGMFREEPSDSRRGGVTGFDLPYHDATVQAL